MEFTIELPYYLVLRNRDYIIGLPVWDLSFGLPYYLVLRNLIINKKGGEKDEL